METATGFLQRELTTTELASLSRHFEDIEFALIRREIDGETVYRLLSGRHGQLGEINANFDEAWTLVYHTHPGGTKLASPADIKLLRDLRQRESQVILPDGSVFKFTPRDRNTLLPR